MLPSVDINGSWIVKGSSSFSFLRVVVGCTSKMRLGCDGGRGASAIYLLRGIDMTINRT